MKDKIKIAIASMLALSTTSTLVHAADTSSQDKIEKCYGIVKAAMNDCQTATSGCAGSSTKDKQGDAFIFLPTGTCQKLVGGSLTPVPTSNESK